MQAEHAEMEAKYVDVLAKSLQIEMQQTQETVLIDKWINDCIDGSEFENFLESVSDDAKKSSNGAMEIDCLMDEVIVSNNLSSNAAHTDTEQGENETSPPIQIVDDEQQATEETLIIPKTAKKSTSKRSKAPKPKSKRAKRKYIFNLPSKNQNHNT